MVAHHKTAPPQSEAEEEAREGVRAFNRLPGVCAVVVGHGGQAAGLLGEAGVSLWVYSTPQGRRLTRRLSKRCKARKLTLTAKLGAGGPFAHLRHQLRAYAVECHGEGKSAADFWRVARGAARAQKRTSPSSAES